MPDANTDKRLTVRFAREEYASLVAKAGNMPLSVFVRETVLGKLAKRRAAAGHAPIKDHRELARILGILGKAQSVASLKAIERACKLGVVDLDDHEREAVSQACDDIATIKRLLMNALGVSER